MSNRPPRTYHNEVHSALSWKNNESWFGFPRTVHGSELFMPSLTLTWLIVLTLSTSFLVFLFSWTSTWSMGCQETTYSVMLKCSIWQSVTTSSLRWNHLDNTPLRAPCSYHLACQNSTLTTLICNTYMASSPFFHAHIKQIELDCHFIHKFFLSDSHNV